MGKLFLVDHYTECLTSYVEVPIEEFQNTFLRPLALNKNFSTYKIDGNFSALIYNGIPNIRSNF